MPRILKRAFFILGILILLLVIFLPGYSKLQELKEKNRELEEKIKKMYIENILLQEELKRIETDPVYQEKIIREKLGVVRDGEVPVKVIPQRKE